MDAIVIGSGIGGLAAAAALARRGRRVLVLERHSTPGGLTQTFRRGPYAFAVGVHYIGGVGPDAGPDGEFGRLLRSLAGEGLEFAPIGSPYDIVRLPGFEFPIEAPRAAFVARLKSVFVAEAPAIDAYFAACDEARRAARTLFSANALPAPVAAAMRWLRAAGVRRALDTTSADAVAGFRDRRLGALLMARWGDYAIPPQRAPLAVHATVLGSYDAGAFYPVGGPRRFAEALGEAIRAAGGEIRTGATVRSIRVSGGRVVGVELESGEKIAAAAVVSAMGARNTVHALDAGVASEWRRKVESLQPTLSYVSLYLGLRGDIRDAGATPANVWIYESEHVERVWESPLDHDAPSLFVSFPSLKDPAHADPHHHTAEITIPCHWKAFERWEGGGPHHRSAAYEGNKSQIEKRLLAQFARHFPNLAPRVAYHELSTPLTQAYFVAADHGAMAGLEMTRTRLESDALRVRTPVPNLLLAGQDVASLGVQGAFMGGFMAAATLEPALWKSLNRAGARS